MKALLSGADMMQSYTSNAGISLSESKNKGHVINEQYESESKFDFYPSPFKKKKKETNRSHNNSNMYSKHIFIIKL